MSTTRTITGLGRAPSPSSALRVPFEKRDSLKDIRELSRRLGLPTSDKPAFAWLASRIPYGERIDAAKLARVEKAEDYLRSLGLRQFRVRSHGDLARIEVDPCERPKLFSEERLDFISSAFESFGFLYSCLDLAGYRRGNLNKAIGERRA